MSSNVKRWEGGCSIGHDAYLESIRIGDGRRWKIEEVNGVSTYTPIYGSGGGRKAAGGSILPQGKGKIDRPDK